MAEKNNFITCLADIPSNINCVIFGAGNAGHNLHNLLKIYRKDVFVEYFIDSYKSGKFHNISLIHPVDFFKKSTDYIVLIATESWYEVEKIFLENNYLQYLKVPLKFLHNGSNKIIEQYSDKIPPIKNTLFNLFYTGQENLEVVEKLHRVENLLVDDDKKLYRLLTCQDMSQSDCIKNIVKYYFNHKPTKQYLDYIHYENISTIIDGGVFDARETADFIETLGNELHIHGFEPNKEILLNSPYYNILNNSCFYHVEKGLWSSNKSLYFSQSGSASHITQEKKSNDNLQRIDVTSIDHYVIERRIKKLDFIKLDIEGAEMEALNGAINTITTHRPQMAICIYHKQSDFYEIPIFLDSILKNYHYRLNHYTSGSCESVWYAIPDEVNNTTTNNDE